MRKFLSIALCLVFVAAVFAGCTPSADPEPEPDSAPSAAPSAAPPAAPSADPEPEPSTAPSAQTYTATAKGNNGDVTVEVGYADGRIESVTVTEHAETAGISDPAIERIPAAIVDNQTLAVDTVSGATNTSKAILAAVEDCITQAGGDVAALKGGQAANTIGAASASAPTEADIVIVGGGGAGLVAAREAALGGASVIVLEKLPYFGGNSQTAGGNYAAVDPVRQANTGGLGGDSIETHIADIMRAGDNRGKLEIATALATNALAGIEWLESEGVEFVDTVYLVNGSTVPRTHANIEHTGALMTRVLLENSQADTNITLLAETTATALVKTGDRVTAVKATAADGTEYEFKANKGVIITTGGYYANQALAMEYSDMVHMENPAFGVQTNTGDGIIMAREIGASLFNMDIIQYSAFSGYGLPAGWASDVGAVIAVNAEGNRFAVENAWLDKDFGLPLGAQPGGYLHTIFDQAAVGADPANQAAVDAAVASGAWFKADTIAELAGLIGVPAAALEKTVADFNLAYTLGRDEFGRTLFTTPITAAPFYGSAKIYPTLRYSLGGINVNAACEVLDESNNPIPGLFAAGECCGGYFGTYRMSSHAIAAITVFGRIAAQTALSK